MIGNRQRRRTRRAPPSPRARAGSDARPPPAAPPAAPAAAVEHPLGPCDKCDGPHATSRCLQFVKDRDDHPDAQRAKGLACGADGGNAYLRRGEVIRQPGDGSCLFHSLAYGLGRDGDGRQLRCELMDWLSQNPDASIANNTVGDWVKLDSDCSVEDYTARMRGADRWGGGIELAAFARRFDVDVHVYERDPGGRRDLPYKRVARFEPGDGARSPRGRPAPVNVFYRNGDHYDALVADSDAFVELACDAEPKGSLGDDVCALKTELALAGDENVALRAQLDEANQALEEARAASLSWHGERDQTAAYLKAARDAATRGAAELNNALHLTAKHDVERAAAGAGKSDSMSLQHECSARARSGKSIRASRALREMIARPKISRNEWETAEIGAFEVGNFALLSCPAMCADSARSICALASTDAAPL